jgi:formylglycine-generating enzyme required for sulfatase activity
MKIVSKMGLFIFGITLMALVNGTMTSARDRISEVSTIDTEVVYDNKRTAMVEVPSGSFEMGYTFEHVSELCEQLRPVDAPQGSICGTDYLHNYTLSPQVVEVNDFYLDLYEVSVQDYTACIDAEICSWEPLRNLPPASTDVPIRAVSYYDAKIYCAWRDARLPTEAEWEYAARGPDNRDFPWGNEFDGTKVNFCDVNCDTLPEFTSAQWDDGYTEVAPINAYANGRSWVGAYNLAGNVLEWTSTQVQLSGEMSHIPHAIVKGGSFLAYPYQTTGWTRIWLEAEVGGQRGVGFRCARTSAPL